MEIEGAGGRCLPVEELCCTQLLTGDDVAGESVVHTGIMVSNNERAMTSFKMYQTASPGMFQNKCKIPALMGQCPMPTLKSRVLEMALTSSASSCLLSRMM
ncbi:hypothetical protein KIL84_006613 [Mauremys mutica]|uniref:Uncharacterized protein n=1 Tax=Mauremys mutica TaxID=74926 RepID=A0A9D3X1J5_9SAUR|nr:hypothetical protein KIL84_006613 [Mauremys mutica]